MKRSYSLEEKLCAIGFVFQGESARSVSRRFHLGHHILYEWLESYKLQGVDGLKSHGSHRDRCLGLTATVTQIPVPMAIAPERLSTSAGCK